MKRCADCETVKPLADYTRRPCGRPVAYCKPCANARWKRYRDAKAAPSIDTLLRYIPASGRQLIGIPEAA